MLLHNLKILVTRPARQAERLCTLLKTYGGEPLHLPTIEIVDVENNHSLHTCRLTSYDVVIFISSNAVEKAVPTLLAQQSFPPSLLVVAVGQRTFESLKDHGISALCPVPPFNSEQVLMMPQLQEIQGQHMVIFRGEGGRELLAETLRQRGATVQYINVYRRVQPSLPAWITTEQIDIITVTSGEGLQNLFTMLEQQSWIRHTPLVVMSQRLVEIAHQLGVQAPIFIAPAAGDEGLVHAVLQAAKAKHQSD